MVLLITNDYDSIRQCFIADMRLFSHFLFTRYTEICLSKQLCCKYMLYDTTLMVSFVIRTAEKFDYDHHKLTQN